MKIITTLDAHIKFGTNLFHLTWEKKRISKIGQYRFYEEKGEFGGPTNESLCFKHDTPIVLGPNSLKKHK
jgi:hypothetical protein